MPNFDLTAYENARDERMEPKLYTFYPLGDIVQCPLALVQWPGHVRQSEIGDIVVPLLTSGADVEFNRVGGGVWGVPSNERD
jgi:hypothetical protein